MARAFASGRRRNRSEIEADVTAWLLGQEGAKPASKGQRGMSKIAIQKHGCTPKRRLGERSIHWPSTPGGPLQKANGRAAGRLLPPPSGQARSRKARYKSNGDVFFETRTRQTPENQSSAALAADPRHCCRARVEAVATSSSHPLPQDRQIEGRSLAADRRDFRHPECEPKLVVLSASLTTNQWRMAARTDQPIQRLLWLRTQTERRRGRSFGRAHLPLRFHSVFVANAPKTPFHRRGKPRRNP